MPVYNIGISRICRLVERTRVNIEASSAEEALELVSEIDDDNYIWITSECEVQDYNYDTPEEQLPCS